MLGPIVILIGLGLFIYLVMRIDESSIKHSRSTRYDNKLYNVHRDNKFLFRDSINGVRNYLDSIVGCTNASEHAVCDDEGNLWRQYAELTIRSDKEYVIKVYNQTETKANLIQSTTYHLT